MENEILSTALGYRINFVSSSEIVESIGLIIALDLEEQGRKDLEQIIKEAIFRSFLCL